MASAGPETLRRNLSSKVVAKTDSIAWARVNALRASREAGSEAAVNEQVEYVIVNGVAVVANGEMTDARPGSFVKGAGAD